MRSGHEEGRSASTAGASRGPRRRTGFSRFSESGPGTTAELAEALGLSRDTVGTSLAELKGEGLCVRGFDAGLWIISEVVERDLREQHHRQEARA